MSDQLAPGTRLGPFEIEALVGSGGMGHVYRAHDPRLGRHVAIKTLSRATVADTDGIRRFEIEARTAGSLDHPNVLVVFDVGRERDVSYIVSELLDGEPLRALIRGGGALPERQVISYAVQVARGLAAAHARGIVHRDLKPENLFLTRDGRVKILDFGVAKLIHAPAPDDATMAVDDLTGPGAAVGTVGYMAPEQVRGEPIDHRADIFGLGVVMHEMLSGSRPFQGDTAPETMTAILKSDPPDLAPTVTPALAGIVRRCLEKRREDRFHSAHDLALALDLLPSATGTRTPMVSRQAAPSRRKVLTYGASSLALIAAGMGGGALLDRRMRPATPPSLQRLTFRRGLIRSARFAPDGQTILYGALWDDEECRVHMVRVDNPESHPIDLPHANLLAVSKTGDVALALGSHRHGIITYGTLARVPIAGGAPRPMLESVRFADWSPDGADLAVVRNVDGRDRLEFPIGRILVEPAVGEFTGLGFPRVSPDGRRVAFVHYRSPASLEGRVSVVDQAGTVTPLTSDYLNIHGLAWHGDEIWYTAADDRPLFRALCAAKPDGTRRIVTRMPGNATLWDAWSDGRLLLAHTDDRTAMFADIAGHAGGRDLSWLDASTGVDLSPDGRVLLFTESGQGSGPEGGAYLRGTDGSPAVRLGAGRALALSPDTRWALCVTTGRDASTRLELLPTGAGESRRLPDQDRYYLSGRWLPDGRRLVVAAVEPRQRTRLYLLDVDDGRANPFTPEGVGLWALSPDGRTTAVTESDGTVRFYPLDGGAPSDATGMTALDSLVGWIDGGLLVVRSRDAASPPGQVYLIDTTTGARHPWRNILPDDPAGIMMLGGFTATPDGRSLVYTWHRASSNLYLAGNIA